MKRVLFTAPVVKVFAAFASIAGIALIVHSMTGMPAPRESDRISSANGEISIIKPSDWVSTSTYPPPGALYNILISCQPPKVVGVGPRLIAGQLRKPPDVEQLKTSGLKPGQFLGGDAMILAAKVKRDFFWRAVFERDGNWYEVVLRLDAPEDVPAGDWWPYITSFRAHIPTTRPATTLPSGP